MEWVLGVILIIAIGFVVNKLTEGGESPKVLFAQKINKAIRDVPNFNPKYQYISEDYRSGIFCDEERGQLCFMLVIGDRVEFDVIDGDKIISSEVIIDGSSLTKSDRSSQLAGAVVGGVLAGGVGVIVGGLSGKKIHQESAKNIKLKVAIDRIATPTRQINFLNSETDKGSSTFSSAAREAGVWHDRVSALIRRVGKDASGCEATSSEHEGDKRDVAKKADNIEAMERLWALKEKGAITESEYLDQKAKLL